MVIRFGRPKLKPPLTTDPKMNIPTRCLGSRLLQKLLPIGLFTATRMEWRVPPSFLGASASLALCEQQQIPVIAKFSYTDLRYKRDHILLLDAFQSEALLQSPGFQRCSSNWHAQSAYQLYCSDFELRNFSYAGLDALLVAASDIFTPHSSQQRPLKPHHLTFSRVFADHDFEKYRGWFKDQPQKGPVCEIVRVAILAGDNYNAARLEGSALPHYRDRVGPTCLPPPPPAPGAPLDDVPLSAASVTSCMQAPLGSS